MKNKCLVKVMHSKHPLTGRQHDISDLNIYYDLRLNRYKRLFHCSCGKKICMCYKNLFTSEHEARSTSLVCFNCYLVEYYPFIEGKLDNNIVMLLDLNSSDDIVEALAVVEGDIRNKLCELFHEFLGNPEFVNGVTCNV